MKHMPTYHFTSPTGLDCMPFDPNGAIFYKGRYHLGYIYQDDGRHFWGHASTTDLINWRMHPPMLSPDPESGIFSGNAFIDKNGRVVLSYHGLGDEATKYPGGNCLAIAQDDDLNVFKKLEANPVMKNPGWDPHTWFEDGIYYSISGGHPSSGKVASLYNSTDDTLAKWNLQGPLMSREMPDVFPDEDVSCPDLFKLGGKHILLCISHIRGARYYVGHFDKKLFHPEAHYRMNWSGGTCFAPETLLDDKGRRIMWSWVLGSPSTMTLPRVLSMGDDGVMNIDPAEELNTLRKNPKSLKNINIHSDTSVVAADINGDCKELQITIDPQRSVECGVKVRCSPDGSEETAIAYAPARKILRIELNKSSLDKSTMPRTYSMTFMLPEGSENPEVGAQEAPFELKPGELLNLRIYLDHSIMEVFANGRQCITQRIWPTRDDSLGISFFSRGGGAKVKSIEAWDMTGRNRQHD
ncbi:MAG: glycoside hydrolase family 32 protein [Victivallales bacterium]